MTEYGMETVLGLATSARIPVLLANITLLSLVALPSFPSMDAELNQFQQPVGLPLPDWKAPNVPEAHALTGRYCRLELLDPVRHGAELYETIASDGDDASWTYMAYGPFASQSAYIDWLNTVAGGADPRFYVIVELPSERSLGVAAYLRVMPASGSIEVGHIYYSRSLRRTRAATEAMSLMMQYAFQLGYRRYEWKCDALNAPSRAAANRLGFQFEGIFRQATVVKGRNRDTAWYAIIDRDWPTIQTAHAKWLTPDNFDSQGQQKQRLLIT